ncbi:Prefoldin subunit 6 [Cryptotrichosporon argae]
MASNQLLTVQAKLQASSRDFQKIEADLAGTVEARQRLDAQLSENELVLKEFSSLKPHNAIYKLTGPALVVQERDDAKSQVQNRLKFIKSEIERVERQLKEQEDKAGKKKTEIMSLQQEFQALQPPSGQAAA